MSHSPFLSIPPKNWLLSNELAFALPESTLLRNLLGESLYAKSGESLYSIARLSTPGPREQLNELAKIVFAQ